MVECFCPPRRTVLQQDLSDQVLQTGVEGLREDCEDLLRSRQAVEEDVV